MLLVVNVTLTSAVIKGSLTAFGLKLSETQETHLSGALQSHLRLMLRKDLVVLRWDHLVLAFNPTESGEQKVLNR